MISFLYKSSGIFEKLKKEIDQPDKNQKQEKFYRNDKLALLITNCDYDVKFMGMQNLPDVKDDRKNMKHTVKNMMGIP